MCTHVRTGVRLATRMGSSHISHNSCNQSAGQHADCSAQLMSDFLLTDPKRVLGLGGRTLLFGMRYHTRLD